MNEDRKKIKMLRGLILFAGLVCLGVIYIKDVCGVLLFGLGILTPFVAGGAVAFVLNLPMKFIEEKLFGRWNNKKQAGLKRGISIVLSLLFVIAVLTFVFAMVIPRLVQTLMDLGPAIQAFSQEMWQKIQEFIKENPELFAQEKALEEMKIDWNSVVNYVTGFLQSGVMNMFSKVFGIAGGIAAGVFDGVIALVFAIYLLAGKERLGAQVQRVVTAYLPESGSKKVFHVISLCNQNFAKFISGQCLEAVILGTMFVVTMTILRMPYATLIGVLIAFTALIPIVGAFIGCVIGAFLILMVSPIQAVGFVILFLVLQQIEGNLIYPRVVGNSVGLPAIWVLAAVSIGGSMFGVLGMLLFIPLMSTGYALLRDNVNFRNKKKQQKVPAGKSQKLKTDGAGKKTAPETK